MRSLTLCLLATPIVGHAGAIISGGEGTAAEKMKAMEAAGITVVKSPAKIGEAMARLLGKA